MLFCFVAMSTSGEVEEKLCLLYDYKMKLFLQDSDC